MFREGHIENALPRWMEEALQKNAERSGNLTNRILQEPIPIAPDNLHPTEEQLRKSRPWALKPYTPYPNAEIAELPEEIRRAMGLSRDFDAQRAPYLERANNYIEQGSSQFPDNVERYMNPYQERVVNDIAALGNRNFNENILPKIESQFIGAGMHGGAQHQQLMERAARDLQESISRQQAQALHQGYQSAGTLFGTDKARQMEAAKLTGDLSEANRLGTHSAIQNLMSTGNYGQQQEQRQLDLDKQRFLRQQDYPFEMLARDQAVINNMPLSNIQTSHMQTPATPVVNAAGNIGAMGLQGAGFLMGQGGRQGLSRGGAVDSQKEHYKHELNNQLNVFMRSQPPHGGNKESMYEYLDGAREFLARKRALGINNPEFEAFVSSLNIPENMQAPERRSVIDPELLRQAIVARERRGGREPMSANGFNRGGAVRQVSRMLRHYGV